MPHKARAAKNNYESYCGCYYTAKDGPEGYIYRAVENPGHVFRVMPVKK